MPRSGGQELFPGDMAYSVWICAQAMPQRGHDLWGVGVGLGRGRKKGSRRPGSWHHSEVSSQVSSDLSMAGRNHKLGSLCLCGRSQALSQVLWVTCLQHDGLQMMAGASVLFPDQAEDKPLWMGYF